MIQFKRRMFGVTGRCATMQALPLSALTANLNLKDDKEDVRTKKLHPSKISLDGAPASEHVNSNRVLLTLFPISSSVSSRNTPARGA